MPTYNSIDEMKEVISVYNPYYGYIKYDNNFKQNRYFNNISDFIWNDKVGALDHLNLDLKQDLDYAYIVISRQTGRTTDMLIKAIYYIYNNPTHYINIEALNNNCAITLRTKIKGMIQSLGLNQIKLIKQFDFGKPKRGCKYDAYFKDNAVEDAKIIKARRK